MKFHITSAARQVLDSWRQDPKLRSHVPTIVWTGDAQGKNWEWSIGTYSLDEIPSSALVHLDGVEFAIEEALRNRLDGKELDYENGYFFVRG